MKYWTCPYCKANLDFGERCECDSKKESTSSSCDQEEQKEPPAQTNRT